MQNVLGDSDGDFGKETPAENWRNQTLETILREAAARRERKETESLQELNVTQPSHAL